MCCDHIFFLPIFDGDGYLTSLEQRIFIPVVQKSSAEFLSYVDSLMSNNTEVLMEGSSTPITCTGFFSCTISRMSNNARALLAGCPDFAWFAEFSPELECCAECELASEDCSRRRLRPLGSSFLVWVIWCRMRWELWMKHFPHWWHLKGLLLWWVLSSWLKGGSQLRASAHWCFVKAVVCSKMSLCRHS